MDTITYCYGCGMFLGPEDKLGRSAQRFQKKRSIVATIGDTVRHFEFSISMDRLQRFCTEHHIVDLSVFGSVLREDFDATYSDIHLVHSYHDIKLKATSTVAVELPRSQY